MHKLCKKACLAGRNANTHTLFIKTHSEESNFCTGCEPRCSLPATNVCNVKDWLENRKVSSRLTPAPEAHELSIFTLIYLEYFNANKITKTFNYEKE